MTSHFVPTNRRWNGAPRLALRIAGSAIFAFAMAYRNVAIAGPSDKDTTQAMPVAAYSAPLSETAPQRAAAPQQSLLVMVDHLQRVSFDTPVKTVLVGNPAIADVTMISETEAVVSARAVGSTNLFFLDERGGALGDYEVIVREGEARRVVLRHGPGRTELYQCAPRCERTLSQMDSGESYDALNRVVTSENKLSQDAANASGDTVK